MAKLKTPLLTVDALIIYEKNNLILIRRTNPPFQGVLALPGGLRRYWRNRGRCLYSRSL